MKMENDLKSMYPEELKQLVEAAGEKSFRSGQLFSWLHEKRVQDYDEMTNLPAAFRQKLKEKYPLVKLEVADMRESAIDGTRKYLFALQDGNVIESVWMKYQHGNSVCISSQVGCRMGCRFCASTLGGLIRSLRASEMLEQIYQIQRLTGERVSNVVIMGTGEPMENYDQVVRFLRLVSMDKGMNISQRSLTVSTCGLVPQMRRFAEEGLQVTLAVSLHAPTDEQRKKMMPVANKYTIEEVIGACRYFTEKTGRRVTIEYALAAGENDRESDAVKLAEVLRDLNCHVNLIPINPVKERSYRRSSKKEVANFQNKLEKCRINVTIRRRMGSDIDGACGQLRKSFIDNQRNFE